MKRFVPSVVIFPVLLFLSNLAFATRSGVLLNFQGLGDLQTVGNFYDGAGLASTPNYGITFSSNFYGLRSYLDGGSGVFTPDPTNTTAIFLYGPTGTQMTGYMNVSSGFSTGIQFFYNGTYGQTVTVWSAANGTGTVLATITLSPNDTSCTNFPSYCNWTSVGINFSGIAKSVSFSGPANGLAISDITLGSSSTAIPEPSTIYLLGTGIAGVALGQLRRFFVA